MSRNPPQNNRKLILYSSLAGLVAGAALASALFLFLMNEQEKRHQEALKLAAQVGNPVPLNMSGLPPQGGGKAARKNVSPEEKKVLEIGKELVRDLEKERLASVYRATTTAYRQRTDRKAFEEGIKKVPSLKRLIQMEDKREYKVKKLQGDKGYEFYFTVEEMDTTKLVNILLVLVPENGEWRISELEISRDKQRG
jgi:hypothetical protein